MTVDAVYHPDSWVPSASTVFYADFDGVFNFFNSRSAYRKRKDAFGYVKRADVYDAATSSWYGLNWSSDLVNKLNALKTNTNFTWLWLTTWTDTAVTVVDKTLYTASDGYVPWDPWTDVAVTVEVAGGWSSGGVRRKFLMNDEDAIDAVRADRKYAALKADQASNPRPFVWVDDNATVRYNPADFTVPHLVVTPDAGVGINHDDYAAMVDFFTKYAV